MTYDFGVAALLLSIGQHTHIGNKCTKENVSVLLLLLQMMHCWKKHGMPQETITQTVRSGQMLFSIIQKEGMMSELLNVIICQKIIMGWKN